MFDIQERERWLLYNYEEKRIASFEVFDDMDSAMDEAERMSNVVVVVFTAPEFTVSQKEEN